MLHMKRLSQTDSLSWFWVFFVSKGNPFWTFISYVTFVLLSFLPHFFFFGCLRKICFVILAFPGYLHQHFCNFTIRLIALDKRNIWKIFFLFLYKKNMLWCSLEVPHWGTFNEHHNIGFHGGIQNIIVFQLKKVCTWNNIVYV